MDITFDHESWANRTGALLRKGRGADVLISPARRRAMARGEEQAQPDAAGEANAEAQGHDAAQPAWHRLDWFGLAARLSAGHALRQSLAQGDVLGDAPSGSFNAGAAAALAGYGAQAGVNADSSPATGGLRAAPVARYEWPVGKAPATDRAASTPEVNPVGLADRKGASGMDAGVAGEQASGD